jgi:hypothetical protein
MANSYVEKFKDPQWQKKRLEMLDRDEWTCQMCGDKSSPLNVHHKWYKEGMNPWEYPDSCLVTLCEDCHSSEHECKKEYTDVLLAEILGKGLFYSDLLDLACQFSFMTPEDFRQRFQVWNNQWNKKKETNKDGE